MSPEMPSPYEPEGPQGLGEKTVSHLAPSVKRCASRAHSDLTAHDKECSRESREARLARTVVGPRIPELDAQR